MDDKGRDCRARPNRGVRVHPLPPYMHQEFKRFLAECKMHAYSNKSTWQLAIQYDQSPWTIHQHMYWSSALKYLNHLEYLGTHNDVDRVDPRKTRPLRSRHR